MTLGRNDFVLTPNGTWHEHGSMRRGRPASGRTGSTSPSSTRWRRISTRCTPTCGRPWTYEVDDMTKTWGNAGLTPRARSGQSATARCSSMNGHPPMRRCSAGRGGTEGSPFDGVMMDYVNPVTNGPVMPTMGASMQMLRPGEATKAHRHTGSCLYHVAKGRGHSIIDGRRFDWQPNATSSACRPGPGTNMPMIGDRGCLPVLPVNDLPVMRALGLYREQAFADNGGHQPNRAVPGPHPVGWSSSATANSFVRVVGHIYPTV
jgi:gentisate 1,2-dioxygenase